ncbi:efflux RND transporter periplasmic adaptor subunit [Azospirillum halopraeferens]|uniref:efflux RND transporter periplasmic adaptor subunit n=1 Tax=Azospirillum halopraeferens TaxID=34010 RepID=UPI00040EF396|nr:efflux RND transporter periplasmic adaptor subunit [Azospirillum halopraeferens]
MTARRTMAAVLTVAMVAGGGSWWLLNARAATPPDLPTRTVVLGTVEDTVSAVGTVQPRTYVDVGTQVSGQLRRIHAEIGQAVERGELLAEIDPTVYEARVAADQAQLQMQRAQLAERAVQLELAEKQYERQRRLYASRTTSETALETADANRRTLAAQIAATEAQIRQTESSLKGNVANLGYTKIYAPMTGIVVDVTAREGQTLNANQQAPIVLRIAELDTMTVHTQVSEADVPRLTIGMPAYFTTLGQPDRRRRGVLRQILPTPEVVNNVVLYGALFDVENPNHDLLPQMSAQVFFVVAEARDVPVVPVSALSPAAGGKQTVRVLEDGRPVERPVELGASNRVLAQVRSGVTVGDRVVVAGPPAGGRPAGGPGGGFGGPPGGGFPRGPQP